MDDKLLRLTSNLRLRSGATQEAIDSVAQALGIVFPIEYAEFVKFSNGAEGNINEGSYARFWPIEQLESENDGYNVAEFAPELVLFGSDGGGMAFAFDRRFDPVQLVMVPFIPLDVDEVVSRWTTFTDFIEYLSRRWD